MCMPWFWMQVGTYSCQYYLDLTLHCLIEPLFQTAPDGSAWECILAHCVYLETDNEWLGKNTNRHLHRESNYGSLLVVSIRYRCGKQQEVLIDCGEGILTVWEIKVVMSQIFLSHPKEQCVLLENMGWQNQVNTKFTLISVCSVKSHMVMFSVFPHSPKYILDLIEYLLLDFTLSCVFPLLHQHLSVMKISCTISQMLVD